MVILRLSDDDFLSLFDRWVEYTAELRVSGDSVSMDKVIEVIRIGMTFYTYGEALLDARRPVPGGGLDHD